jgi:CheY-like chemotaxis protein
MPLLIVTDDRAAHARYDDMLRESAYRTQFASTLLEAAEALEHQRPAAIVLDVSLRDGDPWRWLAELKGAAGTSTIPIVVQSDDAEERKALALGADAFLLSDNGASLPEVLGGVIGPRVLVIDDDPDMRYAIQSLHAAPSRVLEASTAGEGVRAAEAARPDAIVLDLGLPDQDGLDVLERFGASYVTRDIPVIVATSRDLSAAERAALDAKTFAVFSKREMPDEIVAAVRAATRREPRPTPVTR